MYIMKNRKNKQDDFDLKYKNFSHKQTDTFKCYYT